MTDTVTPTKFPHPVLSLIAEGTNKPSYASILQAQKQLNANAESVYSEGGTANHGHLVLVLPPAEFLALTANVPHDPPVHPGRVPVYPGNASAHQRHQIADEHKAALREFLVYKDTNNALRSQLIAACPDQYLRPLKHLTLGYSQVTTLQLLTHLWATYGIITRDDLNRNKERMSKQWHPPSSIEDLFTQIDDAAEFAALGGMHFDDVYLLGEAYKNIEMTGVFTADCRTWTMKPQAEQTFANFRTFFSAADLRRITTTAEAGFHTANAVVGNNKNVPKKDYTAAEVDKMFKEFEKKLQAHTAHGGTSNAQGGLTYCWTHGLSKNKKHDGFTCENKAIGHKESATVDNKMGGSEKVYTAADKRPRAGV
jgi:hypothetical protein